MSRAFRFLPDWRKFTYFILAINVLFLLWILVGAAHSNNCSGISASSCNAATDVGKGIGIALVVFLWVIVDLILGVLYLVTNSGKRMCPGCGNKARKGVTTCKSCGHSFTGPQPVTS